MITRRFDPAQVERRRKTNRIRLVVAITLLPLAYVLGVRAYETAKASGPIPFDRETWASDATPWWSQPTRYRMARRFDESGEFIGKSVDEVRALLDTDQERGELIAGQVLIYTVRDSSQPEDVALLEFILDDQQRVADVFGPREYEAMVRESLRRGERFTYSVR